VKRLIAGASLLCGGFSFSACAPTAAVDESSTTGSESGSDESTDASQSDESSQSEAGSESEGGVDDLPQPERPDFESPAEAEDLDPDPGKYRVELTAAPFEYEIDGRVIEGYAYNEQVPGPTLRVTKGDEVTVMFNNELGMDTTIHWHGLHVPWEMDGVTWMSSPVADGDSFEYSFTVEQAGTYWYHPHIDTAHQADLGLYGAFIIEDPEDPPVDEDIVLLLDGWGETDAPAVDHEGTLLDWTVNGLVDPVYRPDAGTRLRARVIDVANAGYVDLSWPDMRHVASDQGVLAALSEPENLVLSPGDRMDAELLLGTDTIELENRPYSLFGPVISDATRLMSIEPQGEGQAPDAASWAFDQSPPSGDPGYADIVYTLMGNTDAGVWTINGEVFPDVTIETLALDSEAIIELRNVSASEHPFHLHGFGFEVLSVDGVQPEYRSYEDTINVGIAESIRIRLLANNPGDWMAHCHILPHAEEGMMTVLRVE
jgi:FtsP/CotA-like multicopper oxidase with cupredoxin domain